MKRLSTFFILTLLIASCGEPDSTQLIAENKAEAEAQFEQFYACYEIAKTTPDIVKDEINWERNDAKVKYKESNVYQIGIKSFADLAEPLDIALDGTRRREHADMAQLFDIDLSDHKEAHDYGVEYDYSFQKEGTDACREAIKHFLNSDYLLINRILENVWPHAIDSDTYAAGYVKGDVLVFDLKEAKLLGGFRIEAYSKDQMTLKEYSDLSANLMADLGMRAIGKIKERFAELTPSVENSSFEF